MNKFITFFKNKGILATLIGLAFAVPVNIRIMYLFYNNVDISKNQLWTACILNAIAMVWFILPSKFEIISKLFTVKIED